ncbi:hypothetical protein C5S35_17850 [Candidatus Methanophagaceae archaeon]|nr:hypothetical protein C5S35_17850 [Methanophagales archaeon]
MSGEEMIENPEGGTAGLTSACLLDVTDAVGYINDNSSSNIEENIIAEILPFWSFKPLGRSEKFRKILKRSIEKNRDLLMELSKY